MLQRIETLNNEFVERVSTLLHKSFQGSFVSYKIDYFLAKDEVYDRILCISIESNRIGLIFRKVKPLKNYETISDVEEEFIDDVASTLFLSGISHLTKLVIEEKLGKPTRTEVLINLN